MAGPMSSSGRGSWRRWRGSKNSQSSATRDSRAGAWADITRRYGCVLRMARAIFVDASGDLASVWDALAQICRRTWHPSES